MFGARLDLDEAGGAVVDLMISPVRTSRGKPVISTQKALVELKAATGERNEYSALQTSWADWSREHLDSQIERGTRRTITDRQHLTPETYGLVKDKARAEALQERDQASEVVRALHSASGMAPEAIDELRDLLLLQREIQAHKRDPKQYEPPMSEYLMEGRTNVALDLSPTVTLGPTSTGRAGMPCVWLRQAVALVWAKTTTRRATRRVRTSSRP